jgi:DNA-binding CsgD family transcriptional regulator
MRSELRNLQHSRAFDVLFGGGVHGRRLHLSDFSGTRSKVLRGLVIQAERGAGGRAIVERRPVRVDHYRTARTITHDYDREITTEGIQSLVAAPIILRREARGVLYGGLRCSTSLGDRPAAELERAARALAYELEVQEEVELRLRALVHTVRDAGTGWDQRTSESITTSYLALKEIADAVDDPDLRGRIRSVEESLRRATCPPQGSTVRLTPREVDVLSYASLGCGNAEIGERLSLSTDTVKTYMRNLMAKLGTRSRHAAVVEARRQGIIP